MLWSIALYVELRCTQSFIQRRTLKLPSTESFPSPSFEKGLAQVKRILTTGCKTLTNGSAVEANR
jgi:hypothetical protein